MQPGEPVPMDTLSNFVHLDRSNRLIAGLEKQPFLLGEDSLRISGPRIFTFTGTQDEATVWLTTRGMYDTKRGKLLPFPPENEKVPISFYFGHLSTRRDPDPEFALAYMTALPRFEPGGSRTHVYLVEPNPRYTAPKVLAISSRPHQEYGPSQGSISFGNDRPPVRAHLDPGQYAIRMGANKHPSFLDIDVKSDRSGGKTLLLAFGPERTALKDGETVYVGINPEATIPRGSDAIVKLLRHKTARGVYATHLRLSLLDGMLVIEVSNVDAPFGPAHNEVSLGRTNDIHPGAEKTRVRPLLGGVEEEYDDFGTDWYDEDAEESNDARVQETVERFFGDSEAPVWEGDDTKARDPDYREALEQHAINCNQLCYMLGDDVRIMQYHDLYVNGEWRTYLKSAITFGLQKKTFLDLVRKLHDTQSSLDEDRIQGYMHDKGIAERTLAVRQLLKREMSKALHPDLHPGDETLAMQFRIMNELLAEDCPYDPEKGYEFT